MKKRLLLSATVLALFGLATPLTAVADERPELVPGENDLTAHADNLLTGGTLSADGKLWTSATTPGFTLTISETGEGFRFLEANGHLALLSGNSVTKHATVTINPIDPDYYVSGYLFTAVGVDGNEVTINWDEYYITTDNTEQYVWLDVVKEGTPAEFIATPEGNDYLKFTISDIDVVFSPKLPEPEPEPEPEPITWVPLDRSDWVVSGCSQQNNNAAAGDDGGFKDIIDGNEDTFWHASWAAAAADNTANHFLIFDRGTEPEPTDAFGYLPRQKENANGYVTDYAVYFTDEIPDYVLETTCGLNDKQIIHSGAHDNMMDFLSKLTPAVEGSFDFVRTMVGNNTTITSPDGYVLRERTAEFNETANGRYCIFLIKDAVGVEANKVWGNCAEFNLYTITGGSVKPDPDPNPDPKPDPDPDPEPDNKRPTLTKGENDILVNVANLSDGDLSYDGLLWTSDTTPAFTLTLEGEGKMEIVDGDVFRIACGNQFNQHATVTIGSDDPDYFVSGFVFDATGFSGDPAVIEFGDKSITTDNTTQYVWIDGIEEGTPATITLTTAVAGHSKKPIVSNIDVVLSPVPSSITEVNSVANGATEWYNMQGMRVAAPAKGGVYLCATSAGVEKVLVR